MHGQALRVSAPGKVLLTGGYLILEERFAGLVLALSARFHTTISRRLVDRSDAGEDGRLLSLHIESPQFQQTIRAHVVQVDGDRLELRFNSKSDRNSYVEETLQCALNGAMGLDGTGFTRICSDLRANSQELHILLQADNAFYSQVKRLQQTGRPLTRSSLEHLMPFLPPIIEADSETTKTSISKTGLGSSAALVTSLVGAVLFFFLPPVDDPSASSRLDLIHNLAQLSHCFVQRKIGSGFDVSAATYGSQCYSRFPPSLLDAFTTTDNLSPSLVAKSISNLTEWGLSSRIKPFRIPANFHLMMGDVSTGSATVSMVKKVQLWQRSYPVESNRIMNVLATENDAVEHCFQQLIMLEAEDSELFAKKCSEMAHVASENWRDVDITIGTRLGELRNRYQHVRNAFREMGEHAQVPIEPREQQELIDATMEVPGVLMAGVPGAGGYDALFVITLDAGSLDRVEALWLSWPKSHADSIICPLLCDVAPASDHALCVQSL